MSLTQLVPKVDPVQHREELNIYQELQRLSREIEELKKQLEEKN